MDAIDNQPDVRRRVNGVMTNGPEKYRRYKGFTDRSQAEAWLHSCPSEYPKFINWRLGERLIV
jgi:hypothetical protein